MRKFIASLFLLGCASALFGQTFNPDQIRPAQSNGYVLTTVTAGQPPSWQPGGGLVPVWPNVYYSATAPSSPFTYASIIIGGVGYSVSVPSGCAGTYGYSTTLATNSTALIFKDVTTSTNLCTLTFTSASAVPTITGSGGTVSSGDLVELYVATADPSLAGITAELGASTGSGGGGGGFTPGGDLGGSSTSQEVIGILGHALPSLVTGYPNWNGSTWVFSTPSGSGTVTSVGLTLPGIFTVSGSPVTGAGTLAATLAIEAANQVWAGPASGSAAAPGFRALVAADLPLATTSLFGAVKPDGSTITISGGVISASGGSAGNFVNLCSAVTLSSGTTCSGGLITITPSTSFVVSAIPGTYLNLEIHGLFQTSDSSVDTVQCQFNGDTGSHYSFTYMDNTSLGGPTTGQTSMRLGQVEPSSTPRADYIDAVIDGYTSTSFYKEVDIRSDYNSSGPHLVPITAEWAPTSQAAITSMSCVASGGNISGTLTLYGLN